MKAEEYYNKWQLQDLDSLSIEPYQFTRSELIDFAEAYHQSRVNTISDEDIIKASIQQDSMKEQICFGEGAKWIQLKLLKK